MALDWGSIITNPGGALADTAQGKSVIQRNRKSASEEITQLANELGIPPELLDLSDGPMAEEDDDPIGTLLAGAALEVTGIDLFTYGDQKMPHWVPKSIQQYATQNGASGLTGRYDPYYGLLDVQGDERVYMGDEAAFQFEVDPEDIPEPGKESKLYGDSYATPKGERRRKGKQDKVLSYEAAVNMPYTWDEDEVNAAMRKMRQAGLNVTKFDELTQVWGALVQRASKTYTMSLGDKKVTPWDVLELTKKEAKAAGNFTDFENGTQKQTARSVSEISEGASWSVLRQTLSSLLGRDPSDQEVRDYAYRMNTLAAKNPSITETITRYKGGQAVSSESQTTGGFDADDMAREAYEQAQDDPEYAKVQAGTVYYNTLLQAIGAVGDV